MKIEHVLTNTVVSVIENYEKIHYTRMETRSDIKWIVGTPDNYLHYCDQVQASDLEHLFKAIKH